MTDQTSRTEAQVKAEALREFADTLDNGPAAVGAAAQRFQRTGARDRRPDHGGRPVRTLREDWDLIKQETSRKVLWLYGISTVLFAVNTVLAAVAGDWFGAALWWMVALLIWLTLYQQAVIAEVSDDRDHALEWNPVPDCDCSRCLVWNRR